MNPQTVFVDPLLTDVLVGYSNDELIADLLFPKVAVQKESGLYFVQDKSNLIAPGSTKRALNGSANRIKGALSTDTYTLEEHALEEWIDDRILKTYDAPFDPRRNATNRLAGQMAIEKENELISILAAASAGSNSVDVAGAWATTSTDIRAALATAKNTIQKATGVRPNTFVIDRLTYDAIISNTIFSGVFAYTTNRTEENMRKMLAEYFDVKQVLIAGGIKQSAAESGTGSFLWSTKGLAYLLYVAETPAIEEPSAGYQFYKPDMIGVDVRREEGAKSEVVRATDMFVFKAVVNDAIFRLYDTIQT
ncbi:MAG TPA: hypothetical protein PKD15_00835 [Candidatus Saccharibacteria bacterium]|nr:hypothetical protein [Candidatus Saccharibacteria bacterium]